VYDLALPPTTAAGSYDVLLILYRAADGSEVGRAQLSVAGISRTGTIGPKPKETGHGGQARRETGPGGE